MFRIPRGHSSFAIVALVACRAEVADPAVDAAFAKGGGKGGGGKTTTWTQYTGDITSNWFTSLRSVALTEKVARRVPPLVLVQEAADLTSLQADQNPNRAVVDRGRHAPMMSIKKI